jgi:toxin CptA
MHGAPSVTHPVGRSRFLAGFIACVLALAAAGLVAWSVQVQASPARLAAAACVFVAAAAFALRSWMLAADGALSWSGDAWTWARGSDVEPGTPQPVMDLQSVMLLRWSGDGPAVRWLWAERRMQPSTWPDLRRAVYSRARPGGPAPRP